MSSSQASEPTPRPLKAAKAAFKVEEKKVKLEKIPELEQAGKPKKGPAQSNVTGPQPQAQGPIPKIGVEDFRGYIMLAFDKYNQALDAPLTGDPKARYRLDKNDADALIAVTQALDAKYHFMGRWVEYFPEIMAVIVIAGVLGKVAMGMQYKQKEAQMQKGATGAPANTETRAPPASSGEPGPLDRIKKGIDDFKARTKGIGSEDGPPRELVEDAMRYHEGVARRA